MWDIDREKALKLGYTSKEIDAFLNAKNKINTYSPDIVDPFKDPSGERITQEMGANPRYYGSGGHKGVDLANDVSRDVTNPIGGINISGYQRGGYGNYNAVVGANPEELASMGTKQIEMIRKAVKERINAGAEGLNQVDVPGKNIEIQGHLAYPAPDVSTVATGSANLRMGNTGASTGPHLHQEFKDTKGNLKDITKETQKRIELYKNALYK